MLNNDKTGLLIFDNFHIDFNLPKWQARNNNTTLGEDAVKANDLTVDIKISSK